jgi:hypothetical protein
MMTKPSIATEKEFSTVGYTDTKFHPRADEFYNVIMKYKNGPVTKRSTMYTITEDITRTYHDFSKTTSTVQGWFGRTKTVETWHKVDVRYKLTVVEFAGDKTEYVIKYEELKD